MLISRPTDASTTTTSASNGEGKERPWMLDWMVRLTATRKLIGDLTNHFSSVWLFSAAVSSAKRAANVVWTVANASNAVAKRVWGEQGGQLEEGTLLVLKGIYYRNISRSSNKFTRLKDNKFRYFPNYIPSTS